MGEMTAIYLLIDPDGHAIECAREVNSRLLEK
jgi:hypothetical protein